MLGSRNMGISGTSALLRIVGAIYEAGPYGDDDRALLRTLLPHFQRATRIHRQAKNGEAERSLLSQVIERLPLGVVIMAAGGALVAANRMAHTMLATAARTPAEIVGECGAGNGAAFFGAT